MLKTKLGFSVLALMMLFTVILTGCGTVPPKEALQKAYEESMNINSSSFEGSIALDFTPPSSLANDPNMMMAVSFLQNAEFKIRGTQQLDPLQAEVFLDINLKGDLAMQLSIPMVITEEKIWIKVPNIPMVPLPPELVGKFVELDFAKLSELSDGEIPADYKPFDIALQQQFSAEVLSVMMKHYDEETYFSHVAIEEAALPAGIEAEQVVKFEMNNEQVQQGIRVFVEKVIPEMFDVMADPKYASLVVEQGELEQLKSDYETNKEEALKELDTLNEYLKVNDFSMVTAINKDNHIPFTEFNLNVDITEEEETSKLGVKITNITSNFNEEPVWEIDIPKEEEVLTIDQLQEMYFMGF